MQRSVSNIAARRQRFENSDCGRDLADAIEAELIGAKHHQKRPRRMQSFTQAASTPHNRHFSAQENNARNFPPKRNSAKSAAVKQRERSEAFQTRPPPESVTSDDYDDEHLERPVVNKARLKMVNSTEDCSGNSEEDDEKDEENSWSNKKFRKRLINDRVNYDVTRTSDMEMEMEEKDDTIKENQQYHHHNQENLDGGEAVFQNQLHDQSNIDEQKQLWTKIMRQHSQRQRPVYEDRDDQLSTADQDQSLEYLTPDFHIQDEKRQPEQTVRKSFESSTKIPDMQNVKKIEKPIQQQKPPKTLSFAPQTNDGRPPLPLDARKLQQQQQQAQRRRQKMQEKKRKFPVEDFTIEGKKEVKIETVPETYHLHVLQWIENGTRRFLWHLGRRLTSVPTLTVVLPLIICAICAVGVIVRRDSLRMVTPFHTFFTPESESNNFQFPARITQQIGQSDFFNASNPRYDAFRTGANLEGGNLELAVILKSDDHNVLEEDTIDSYLRLRKKIEEIKIVHGPKMFKYQMLCRRTQKETCQKDIVETLMNSGKTIKFHYPETTISNISAKKGDKANPDKASVDKNASMTFFIGNTFGGVDTDQDGAMSKAEALAMYFKLRPPPKSEAKDPMVNGLEILRSWDDEFQRVMKDEELAHSRGKSGSVSWWSYGAFSNEVLSTFNRIYIFLTASLAVFVAGCLVASLRLDSYTSKPGVGMAAAITIILIIGGGWCVEIGITGYVNPAIFPAFFFIAATALHFMINTLQSWRKYCVIATDPGERVRVMMTWDLPCLLWCCFILSISYVITAAVVSMSYFRSISQLLAASTFLTALLILLLFVGAVYLSGKRELAGLKWFQCGTKVAAEFPPPLIRRYHKRDVQLLQKKMRDEQPHPLRSMGEFAANVHARYVALLIFCIYLIFAAWGCSLAPIRINERQYIKSSSNLHKFLDDYAQYYNRYDNYLVLTFHESIDYFDNRVRSAILDMFGWVEMQEHVAERTISWLKEFTEFEKSSIYLINRDTFVPVVDLIFLKEGSPYQKYSADIAFGRYREQIVASRMYIELNSVGIQRQLDVIKTLSNKAADAGIPMSIKSPTLFLLHHDVQITWVTVTAFIVLIGIMGILTFFVFGQPYLTLLTVLNTCSVTVGTIGFTALWDVPINALNMGAVLAGVLHSAALCISCCYQYSNSGDPTAVKRMAFTFQSWLPGAVWSCGIGIAAFAPLLFIECQIIQHLAKLVLCHFVSILVHVCVFLPPCVVVLTTSIPQCCKFIKRMCEDSCCLCCSSDEDATSIYYIPTGGRALDPIYVQQFYQLKFREDILPVAPQPLPPPPVREMLMPPPPRGGPPSSITGSAAQMGRPQSRQRCTSPTPMLDSRLHSARSSMQQRHAFGNGPNPNAKVYRYGSNCNDFEEIMRARTARAAVNKRPLSPDPGHRSRRDSPDIASPRTRHRSATTSSPLVEQPPQRLDGEEIYHEPSDPETISMQTNNTNTDINKPTPVNSTTSPPGANIDSGDEDSIGQGKQKTLKPYDSRIVEVDGATLGGPPKSKITYAKWSKEIPLDPFTTERVTAEKYTIDCDGATIDLPPDWKRYWIKGNLRGQAAGNIGANGRVNPDVVGMVPPGDHHIPMHPHPSAMPMQAPGAGPHFRAPPNAFRHPPPTADGPQMMMPPYGAPPPLPPRPPFGLPRAPGTTAYKGQHQANFRKTPAWMY